MELISVISILQGNTDLIITERIMEITKFRENDDFGVYEEGSGISIKNITYGCKKQVYFFRGENSFIRIPHDITRSKGIAKKAVLVNVPRDGKIEKYKVLEPDQKIEIFAEPGRVLIPLSPEQAKRKIEKLKVMGKLGHVMLPLDMCLEANLMNGFEMYYENEQIVLTKGSTYKLDSLNCCKLTNDLISSIGVMPGVFFKLTLDEGKIRLSVYKEQFYLVQTKQTPLFNKN